MHAIVDLNGKQYQVEEGRYLLVDRLPHDEDATFDISNVLMVVNGEQSLVGAPFVEGATVTARVLRHERGAKLLVYKMRCKKGYRRKNGHRQDYTRLQIEGLEFPGKPPGSTVTKEEKPAARKTAKVAEGAETATEEKPKKAPAKNKAETATAADKPKKAPAKKPAAKAKVEESTAPEAEAQTSAEE